MRHRQTQLKGHPYFETTLKREISWKEKWSEESKSIKLQKAIISTLKESDIWLHWKQPWIFQSKERKNTIKDIKTHNISHACLNTQYKHKNIHRDKQQSRIDCQHKYKKEPKRIFAKK
jgi:hypothetical protein